MQQRLPSLLDPPIGFAHRGAMAHAPQNTLEAFRLARKLGATGLESDVWRTADGHLVLDHDGTFRVGLRKRPVWELRREQLPSYVPTLGELVDACGTDVDVSLDVKDPGAGPHVIAEVRAQHPVLLPRLWLCYWELDVLATWRPLDPDVRLVDSTRLLRIKEGPERRAARLRELGVDALNLHHRDWSGGLTTLCHRFDRLAFAWDLQYEEPLRRTIRMGIDAVYSDWVDRMVDALAAEAR